MGMESTEGSGENLLKLFAKSLNEVVQGPVPGELIVLENHPWEKLPKNTAKDPKMMLVHGLHVTKMPEF